MLNEEHLISGDIEGGIISFKNLQGDYFLKFTEKDRAGKGASKNQIISKDTLENYSVQLKKLILEICDSDIDFVEKEIKTH